jgi:hypothetical protein
MIAAGRIDWLPARTPWPMHAALRELYEGAGRPGLRASLRIDFSFEPSPDVGLAVRGADLAFSALLRDGLLMRTGTMLDAGLLVDDGAVVAHRRRLMTLEPAAAVVVQRGGSRWTALASTVAKNPAAHVASEGSMVASATV